MTQKFLYNKITTQVKINRITYIAIALLIISFFTPSCSRPKEVHNRKDMERILYDVYIAEAIIENDYSNFNTPEKKEALINEVFKKHKTTQARWDTSLSWYSDRVEIYLKMNDSVRNRLQRHQKHVEAQLQYEQSMIQSVTDRTILTSNIPFYYSFDEVNPKGGFRFILDSTYIKEKLDSIDISFSFDVLGIPQNSNPKLTSQLILEYKDTTIYISDSIHENIHFDYPIKRYLEDDTLSSILGYIKLQDTLRQFRNIKLMNIYIGNTDSIVRIQPAVNQEVQKQLMKEVPAD